MNLILSLPKFQKEKQYVELSPKEGKNRWRFKTKTYTYIKFAQPLLPKGSGFISFKDRKGKTWMTINGDTIKIYPDYAWDGCTPKYGWGIWWGAPDFEKTRLASLVHDVLLQFRLTNHFPITRDEIDNIFRDILNKEKFMLRNWYYVGARFGTTFLASKPDKHVYSDASNL